jgi:hypothetical protein
MAFDRQSRVKYLLQAALQWNGLEVPPIWLRDNLMVSSFCSPTQLQRTKTSCAWSGSTIHIACFLVRFFQDGASCSRHFL